MQLSKLIIKNFRNFKDTEVRFKEGINVVLGPNNAGKTNLIRAICFLKKTEKLSMSDFNYNNLFDKYNKEYKEYPPVMDFYYEIEHCFSLDEVDSAIIKLKNFIIYEDDGNLLVRDDNTCKIRGSFRLSYELNNKFLSEYKNRIAAINDDLPPADKFAKFEEILEDFLDKYEWICYNDAGEAVLSFSEIRDIFNIDFIPADRKTDTLLPEIKRFIKQKIDDQGTIRADLKRDISAELNDKLSPITEDILAKFAEGQKDIGITKGRSSLIPSFKYDNELDGHFFFHLKDEDKGYNLPLDSNGLGYNNLIQIYNIITFKISDDYNILLIEEPEAHLHPAMQYQLFSYLQKLEEQAEEKIKNQIIITTHSSNISASANIDDIITLHYYKDLDCNVVAENLKDKFIANDGDEQSKLNDNKNHLKKFLDITRSDMLFTEKVILVEGLAEKLLVPMFAKNAGIDLINNHIAIVEVGGITFNHFLPLFKNTKNRILCITDCDHSYLADGENLDLAGYKDSINGELIDNRYQGLDNIKAITQKNGGSTFESELFLDNLSAEESDSATETVCKKLLKIVFPDAIKTTDLLKNLSLDYWNMEINLIRHAGTKKKIKKNVQIYKKSYDAEADAAKKQYISNLFFANLFLEYASSQKGNLALSIWMDDFKDQIKTPEYIKEGLEWIK